MNATPATADAPVALITGGAQRLGAAITRGLHASGMRVVIHCRRSRGAADALAAQLNTGRAASAAVVSGDLVDGAQREQTVTNALACFGRLDALINNASAFYPTLPGETSDAQWEELLGTNLKAPYFLIQHLLPELSARCGCVVNLVDYYASHPLAGHPVYSAAKAGLAALTRALARELGPEIRVNGVAPGAILWPDSGMADAAADRILAETALGRRGEPEEIAHTVRFLVQEAGFITGQIIGVDGGRP